MEALDRVVALDWGFDMSELVKRIRAFRDEQGQLWAVNTDRSKSNVREKLGWFMKEGSGSLIEKVSSEIVDGILGDIEKDGDWAYMSLTGRIFMRDKDAEQDSKKCLVDAFLEGRANDYPADVRQHIVPAVLLMDEMGMTDLCIGKLFEITRVVPAWEPDDDDDNEVPQ